MHAAEFYTAFDSNMPAANMHSSEYPDFSTWVTVFHTEIFRESLPPNYFTIHNRFDLKIRYYMLHFPTKTGLHNLQLIFHLTIDHINGTQTIP